MEIGVVGKPNVGKSTFFSAVTMAPAEIASYPFTTIKPNRGIAFVRTKCPHLDFNTQCNPRNSKCENGTRYVPIEMIDVAGLVPDAHKGKGLGNQFLDDLRQASALIHIVDASGCTDFDGNICAVGSHNPIDDINFLEKEIVYWLREIIMKGWDKIARQSELEGTKVEVALHSKLTGLGITESQVYQAVRNSALDSKPSKWDKEDMFRLASKIQEYSKPMIIAANKCDIASNENLESLKNLEGHIVVPTSAEYELALRRAAKAALIDYQLGSAEIKILNKSNLTEKQLSALKKISEFLQKFGSTGIQKCIEEATYRLLDSIVIFPVEDETKLTDKENRVLPDAYLMRNGSNARDLAYKVHTELGENFIRAINARTKRVVGQDYKLQNGDVIKIVAKV